MSKEAFPLGAIPERLKCSICTALAKDAWKLPCCDQIVCGSCYEQLPADACPICAFTPMEKDKCTVSTSLRTTIAVFLRHAEKRYKDALAKEAQANGTTTTSNEIRAAPKAQTSEIMAVELSGTKSPIVAERIANAVDQSSLSGPEDSSMIKVEGHVTQEQQGARQPNQTFAFDPTATMPMNMDLGMGFNPMLAGFPMDQMSQMMMQQMAMPGGYGGFSVNGMGWNPNMQGYPQNMNMQNQESNYHNHAPPIGPSVSNPAPRGGFRGRYSARGAARGGRGAYQANTASMPPVYVEGAPTGPSAMRNGASSRGRGAKGRESVQRDDVANHFVAGTDNDRDDTSGGSQAAHEGQIDRPLVPSDTTPNPVSRDRSVSANQARSPHAVKKTRSRSPFPRRPRSSSPTERSRKRERSYTERESNESVKLPPKRSRSRSPIRMRSPKDKPVAPRSLADRIEKMPRTRSRSRSPIPDRHKSRRSSHRSRRYRSTSRERSVTVDRERRRSRSRSGERRERSHRHRSRDRDDSRRHKSRRSEVEDSGQSERKDSARRRSREGDSRRHRSNPKHEMRSPELRRIEKEREKSRYR